MPKPIVQIRNAQIQTVVGGHVLAGELASKHPKFGEGARIRTSLIVEQRLSSREVETLNTVYQLVD